MYLNSLVYMDITNDNYNENDFELLCKILQKNKIRTKIKLKIKLKIKFLYLNYLLKNPGELLSIFDVLEFA